MRRKMRRLWRDLRFFSGNMSIVRPLVGVVFFDSLMPITYPSWEVIGVAIFVAGLVAAGVIVAHQLTHRHKEGRGFEVRPPDSQMQSGDNGDDSVGPLR